MTFRECDDNQDNFISTRELGWAMRVMGHNPTEAELQELANRVSISNRASNEDSRRLREGLTFKITEKASKGLLLVEMKVPTNCSNRK